MKLIQVFILLISFTTTNLLLANSVVEYKELKSYWSDSRKDNFTTATTKGEKDAKAWKYSFTRVEGYIFTKNYARTLDPTTVKPLKLYWNEGRKDNFTTATKKGDSDAKILRYRFAETLGYVYTNKNFENGKYRLSNIDEGIVA